jgi:hypothetical protein
MTVIGITSAEKKSLDLDRDYEAAKPYLERLKQYLLAVESVSSRRALQRGLQDGEHRELVGLIAGYSEARTMIDRMYYDLTAQYEHERKQELARIEADAKGIEGDESSRAGKRRYSQRSDWTQDEDGDDD